MQRLGFSCLEPGLFSARSGHSLVSNGNTLYLFGGFDGSKCYNDLWAFTLDGGWRPILPKEETSSKQQWPTPRTSHCAVDCESLKGMLVMFGTEENFGDSNLGSYYFFDYATESWEDLTQVVDQDRNGSWAARYGSAENRFHGKRIEPMYGVGLAWDDSTQSAICFGGTMGRVFSDLLYAYHVPKRAWVRLQAHGSMPTARYLSRLAITKQNSLLCFGGGIPNVVFHSDPFELFELNLTELSWKRIVFASEIVMTNRISCSMARLKQDMFVFYGGGCRQNKTEQRLTLNMRLFNDTKNMADGWIYRHGTREWQKIKGFDLDSVSSRDFHGSAVLDNDVYVVGGVVNGLNRSNEVFRLRLFTKIPTLQDCCLSYLKQILTEEEYGDILEMYY